MNRPPGAFLVHPLTLSALALLIVNDHVLKLAYPGWLSGKLSDFAGLLLLPLFLHGSVELAIAKARGRALDDGSADRLLVLAVTFSALVFALPEIWAPADAAYRYGLGAAQWPFRVGVAWLREKALPSLRPVRATPDVTDLLALPMAYVAYRVGKRAPIAPHRRRNQIVAGAATLLLGITMSASASAGAKVPFRHEGFYLALEAGAGGGFVDSTGSVNNGFAQEIPSKARAVMAPLADVEVGSSVFGTNWVLGGRFGFASGREPVIETLGERFRLRGQELIFIELVGIAKYFPDPKSGLHFGASLGTGALGVSDGANGANFGFAGSLEVGHAIFFARQWSLGATLRFTAASVYGREHVDATTTFLMPAALATVSYH